ncbi:MAG: hypothetical protein RhofKO_33910 [Rhodothermales bacterium]
MLLVKKSSAAAEALGRSRGGFTTKLHALCDALGNPIRFLLAPGQRHDLSQAANLLDGVEAEAVLADRGYDANWLVAQIAESGAEVVIPPKRNRKVKRLYDANLYADRNKVERLFGRLKQYRRVATRYEKTASSYLGMVYVAGIMTLLA